VKTPALMRRIFADRRILLLACAVGAWAAAAVLFSLHFMQALELRFDDRRSLNECATVPCSTVAVVGIDENLFERDGFEWPLDKNVYGDLIDFLDRAGARAIAFDIVFSNEMTCGTSGDTVFRGMLEAVPTSVLGIVAMTNAGGTTASGTGGGRAKQVPREQAVERGTGGRYVMDGAILPYSGLLELSPHLGLVNLAAASVDGVTRTVPLLVRQDTLLYPTLSLQAVRVALNNATVSWNRTGKALSVNGRSVPVDRDCELSVRFADSIPEIPLSLVRRAHRAELLGQPPPFDPALFKGRVVFVGNTAYSLGDYGVSPASQRDRLGRTPNVHMHARAAASLLSASAFRRFDFVHATMLSFGAVLALYAVAAFLSRTGSVRWIFLASLVILSGLFAAGELLHAHMIIMPVLQATFGVVAALSLMAGIVFGEKNHDRAFLKETFGRYLAPRLIDEMAEKKIRPTLGGEACNATAFFSDIESFSTFSEALGASDLIAFLNNYLGRMTGILLDDGGTLDKYIGDAIVAFFGAPNPSETHPADACRAAIRMQESLAALRREWALRPDLPPVLRNIHMRIGLNSGNFVVGNVGSEMRMNYTMLGDTVNLAARLESIAKEYGVYTLAGSATREAAQDGFLWRAVDRIRVAGRSTPETIYQLIGIPRPGDERWDPLLDRYDKALSLYIGGDFALAADEFTACIPLEKHPDRKNPSRVLAERCEKLMKLEQRVWDGAYTFTSK